MMKMNRKALALLAAALLTVSAAGCGNPAEDSGPALEAMASLPESGRETGTEPTAEPTTVPTVAPTAEPTAAPTVAPTAEPTTEPTVEPTTEPAATTEPTVEPTVEPTTEPAATAEPTTAPAATAEPEKTSEPAAAEPVTEDNSAPLQLVPNAPATSGVVTSTETVTTQVEHQRPEGMPAVCYSEEEMLMAMLFYGQPGDGYTDNGDGTYTYCWCGPDGSTTDTVTSTVTTTNWYSGTEADVLAKLDELKAMYPDGTVWNEDSVYEGRSALDAYISNSNACAGYAKLVSDYCFGADAPVRSCWITIDKLRPGDIILGMSTEGAHADVYTGGYEPNGTSYLVNVTDGNEGGLVNWDTPVFMVGSYGDGTIEVLTRWPE